MRWGFSSSILFSAIACLDVAAAAADISFLHPADPDSVILITGEIALNDERKFNRLAATRDNAIVALNSTGGSTIAAIEIGKAIRLKGFSTLVVSEGVCTSACALIWLAGTPRILTRTAQVGFHATFIDDNGRRMESGVGNAIVGRYLTLLNLPERALIFATLAGPNEVNWLTASNADAIGIETVVIDLEEKTRRPTPPELSAPENTRANMEVEYWKAIGNWSISIDKTLDDTCFMMMDYNNGTTLRIGFRDGEANGSYLAFGNPRWRSLSPEQKVELKLVFDSETPWTFPATVHTLGKDNVLLGRFSDIQFWREFSRSKTLHIYYDDRPVNDLDLAGSAAALQELVVCQRAQQVAGDPFRK